MAGKIADLFDDFAEDFLSESIPRTIIIVGSSKIDDSLATIISKMLTQKLAKPKDNDELLEGDRPLATFSARIKMAYRLGLIDLSLYELLDKVRKIRNIGAHQLAFNISSSPLKEHAFDLKKLTKDRKSYKLTRERYFQDDTSNSIEELKCALLSICVLLEAVNRKVRRVRTRTVLHKITAN